MKLPLITSSYNRLLLMTLVWFFIFFACTIYLINTYTTAKLPFISKQIDSKLFLKVVDDKVTISQPFQVAVSADTGTTSVNAAGIFLRYDPQALQLIDIDTRSSFCQFYPEKTYDNREGTVSLTCGSPHPGFKGTNTLMILEFIPKIEGKTIIKTDPISQLVASNGKGDNILSNPPSLDIDVSAGL